MYKKGFGRSLKPGARQRLESHVGWSGWTRPPTMKEGLPQANRFAKGGVGGFLEISERPEAG